MDRAGLNRIGDYAWRIDPVGEMRVPAIIFADEALIDGMDDKVREQIVNVTTLPGIVGPAYAMPDAHWGYGFPIGGVAAFSPEEGGVISAGGVGFDISCGVRLLTTGLRRADIEAVKPDFAHELSRAIPAGVGSKGSGRKKAGPCAARCPSSFRRRPTTGNARRWARSAPATTTWRFRRWGRSTILTPPGCSVLPWATSLQ
jgi:hypothetical protein